MRCSVLIVLLLCVVVCSSSRSVVIICMPSGSVVNSGRCILYNAQNDSIGSVSITNDGVVKLPDTGFESFEVNAVGFTSRLISIAQLTSDTIFVKPQIMLNEVEVTPDKVTDLGNRLSYRIPMSDLGRYTNLYQALNEIPHLTILPTGGAFYEGGSDIQFLLNGVETSVAELQTISKEDISNVDVYRNPPAKFALRGIATVIDVRTKSNLTGGNFGVNVDQAFYPIKGDNSLALYYNYRRSRFSLLYSGSNAHYNEYRLNEYLEYEFDGVTYKKTKEGKDSDSDYDLNNVTLSFQNNKANSYLYNLQIGLGWNRNRDKIYQNVTSNFKEFDAINFLKTDYNKYNIANYFEKQLGEDVRYGTILGNVNYQHFDTRYVSSYQEFSTEYEYQDLVNNYSAYKTRVDGVLAEIQYEFPKNRAGYFSIAAYNSYKRSEYVDNVMPFSQTTSTYGASASWNGKWKSIIWVVRMGVLANYTNTTMLEKSYNTLVPEPIVRLTWWPRQDFILHAEYKYSLDPPSIAQLSETDQWLDTRLVYHGNSLLKPSRNHSVFLQGVFNNSYLNASLRVGYNYSPNMLCSQYVTTDRYMLETIVNLDRYEEILGRLDVNVMPLGNNKLSFWNRVILSRVSGNNMYYSWNGNRFQWMSVLSLNLDKWTVLAYYQYPGQIADGQLIRPRAECWYFLAFFRPIKDLSLGLKLYMPFGKGFRESEHTVKDAPVYSERGVDIRDCVNYVALQLSWNVSFGRNNNRAHPKFGNADNDAGLLRK